MSLQKCHHLVKNRRVQPCMSVHDLILPRIDRLDKVGLYKEEFGLIFRVLAYKR